MSDLREHEAGTLRNLRWATYRGNWIQPMDIGGRDSSHHSRTLAKLCRLGLAERKEGGGVVRGSWRYRAALTEEEREAMRVTEAEGIDRVHELARQRRARHAPGGVAG